MKKIINGKNFILRPFRKDDAKTLAKNINDRLTARNTLTIPYPYKLSDAKKWLNKSLSKQMEKNPVDVDFAIEIGNEVIGAVGLSRITGHKAEVGYWLTKKYRGKGIMSEALSLVTDFAFKDLKLKRIYAFTFPWNKASMVVLEKNGYRFEGILKKNVKKGKVIIDSHLFAKTK